MTSKRKYVLCAIAGVGAAGLVGIAGVSAESATKSDSLAGKIASAFHLNQTDVQKVIDTDRADHRAAMEQKFTDRLNQAVTDGKITAAQKDQILAKQKELTDTLEANKDKDPAARHAAIKTEMDSLKQWATDNKIPLNLLGPMHHHPMMDAPPAS
jgi:hypothetical protein